MIPPSYMPVSVRTVLPVERESGDVAVGLDTDGTAGNAIRIRLTPDGVRGLIDALEASLGSQGDCRTSTSSHSDISSGSPHVDGSTQQDGRRSFLRRTGAQLVGEGYTITVHGLRWGDVLTVREVSRPSSDFPLVGLHISLQSIWPCLWRRRPASQGRTVLLYGRVAIKRSDLLRDRREAFVARPLPREFRGGSCTQVDPTF